MKNVRGERVRERDRSTTFHLLYLIQYFLKKWPSVSCLWYFDGSLDSICCNKNHTHKKRQERSKRDKKSRDAITFRWSRSNVWLLRHRFRYATIESDAAWKAKQHLSRTAELTHNNNSRKEKSKKNRRRRRSGQNCVSGVCQSVNRITGQAIASSLQPNLQSAAACMN